MPAGSEVRISERTPGEASAPSRLGRGSRSGSTARLGAWAVNQIVPAMTLAAETISALAGETPAASTAVSSGPRMKISSISTESSA